MSTPPPTFQTESDIRAYIERRADRLAAWWTVPLIASFGMMNWAMSTGLGSSVTAASMWAFDHLGDLIGVLFSLAAVLSLRVLLPVLSWAVVVYRTTS